MPIEWDHFQLSEFRCKGHNQKGHQAHPTCVADELVELLERLRHAGGDLPLRILSGHRCAWYNRKVGGAAASQHLLGNAVDLRDGVVPVERAVSVGFRGIGTKGGYAVHLDVREHPTRWAY